VFGQKNGGIILKTYFPHKRKIVLLDQKNGKINAVPPHENVQPGVIIAYTVASSWSPCSFLNNVEIIYAPLMLAQNDILFIHHFLELCYYLIPYGICDESVFDLIYQAYKTLEKKPLHSERYKLLVLYKLLNQVGLYCEDTTYHTMQYYKLAKGPIEEVDLHVMNNDIERSLYKWVYTCLESHPCYSNLKTINFLTAGRGL